MCDERVGKDGSGTGTDVGGVAVPDPKSIRPQPVTVPVQKPMIGFLASAYTRPGEQCLVEVCGFHTFDEGLSFYKMLEGFNDFVRKAGGIPSCVDRILVAISPDKAHVYLNNNLPVLGRMRVKRSCDAGEAVFRDDIAGIDRLDFPNIDIPERSGFMLLVSVDWRKGMCFDLRPLDPDSDVTSQEAFNRVKQMGGMILSHLWFTEKFLLSSQEWVAIFAAGWFPFIFLPHNLWEGLFQATKHGAEADVEREEEKIHNAFLSRCDERVKTWKANKYFDEHMAFLEPAVAAYKREEWVTVISVAAPRVEGLLRKAFGSWGKQKDLMVKTEAAVAAQEPSKSLLFPEKLREYFENVLYPFTDFKRDDLPATRHTLAHGLVSAEKITRKQALTLMLLIDHILYCMPIDDEE